ncbi:2-amino-4-hydroxy-6-hydroxymethyldihydropteridinepyrophosphokinase [Halioglobus japonicus]|nr:2-amino-4-hydroxy-6-hydroxymethyldihydropteridinepyrophosphokinase [Halioglobus japonicus]
MTPAYIAMGSNLDDPEKQLCRAVIALKNLPNCQLEQVSSVYSSAAVGPGSQPDYLNAVVRLLTPLSAIQLLDCLQQIEHQQGRIRDTKWGPRTLDLDILLYGDSAISSPRLSIPHPQMQHRHFVLYPLCEISGEALTLPDGTTLEALLQQCSRDGLVKTQYPLCKNTSTHCHSLHG